MINSRTSVHSVRRIIAPVSSPGFIWCLSARDNRPRVVAENDCPGSVEQCRPSLTRVFAQCGPECLGGGVGIGPSRAGAILYLDIGQHFSSGFVATYLVEQIPPIERMHYFEQCLRAHLQIFNYVLLNTVEDWREFETRSGDEQNGLGSSAGCQSHKRNTRKFLSEFSQTSII